MAINEAVLALLVTMKDEASAGLGSLAGAVGNLGMVAGGVAVAGVAALGGAIASGVADARDAALVMAQTQAAIESTGGAAGYTADQVADMAGSLSAATGLSLFGDADIQRGQNMLLTFTNIKETLPDTTQTMIDMAQALGSDMAGQAMQLGKALNDPIAGISALTRVGVTFTDEQKNMIATMQNAGDMAGAQQVILAELNKEFGGSAKAAAEADGGWAQFNDRLGEAKETMGAALIPALTFLVGVLNDQLMPLIEAGAEAMGALLASFTDTSQATTIFSDVLAALQPIFDDIWAAAQEVWATLVEEGQPILEDLAKIALPALVSAGQIVAALWSNVLAPALQALWYIIKTYLLPGLGMLVHVLSIILPPVLQAVAYLFTDILAPGVNLIIQGLNIMGRALEDVIGFFADLAGSIGSIEIPAWLTGHSPPPLANWLASIADSADAAGAALGDVRPVGGIGAAGGTLPLAGGGMGGGLIVNWSGDLIVQGAADPEATALAVRQELLRLGARNLDIFGGLA